MIELREIDDIGLIESVLTDDEMWCRISEDGQSREDFKVLDKDEYLWIGVYAEGTFIGIYFFHPLNYTTLQIHAHILRDFRADYAKLAGREIVKYFANDLPKNWQKLVAEIPTIYKNVYHYTKNQGFTDEGINRKSYTKNGQIIDQYRLGMTRDEACQIFIR